MENIGSLGSTSQGRRNLLDTHTHTVLSTHAYSTLWENARAASSLGVQVIVSTEHAPEMPGGAHIYGISNQSTCPRVQEGVIILRGVEANIMPVKKGGVPIDIPDAVNERLDVVVASLHDAVYPQSDPANITQTLMDVVQSGRVDILGHLGNPHYSCDYFRVMEVAKANNVLVEINNSSLVRSRLGSKPNCGLIATIAAQLDMHVVLSSDAHHSSQVGIVDEALALALGAGIREDKIYNYDPLGFVQFLVEKRNRKGLGDVVELLSGL